MTKEANPYNSKQSTLTTEEVPRGILSADDGLAPPRQPEVKQEAKQSAVVVESTVSTSKVPDVPVEAPVEQFKKVDYKKRYDDLKKHYDNKLNEFKGKEKKLTDAIKDGRPAYNPPRTPEELATYREEDPDGYATIEAIADLRSQEQIKDMQEQLATLTEREKNLSKKEAFSELSNLQPDFEEIKGLEAFHEWVPKQPQDIQDWLYNSFNAKLASRAIDLFKQDVGWKKKVETKPKPKSKPRPKPSAADVVSVASTSEPDAKTAKVWKTSEIDHIARHSPMETERLMPEWDKAFKEGRVVKG